MGASVVAGVDASPVLEAPEHDFDLVALAIEDGVVWEALPQGLCARQRFGGHNENNGYAARLRRAIG